jgi:hypothetical protein
MKLRYLALTLAIAGGGVALMACSHDETQARLDPAPRAEMGFFLVDEGDHAKLAYGEANSDNVGLMLECAKGSGVVQVTDLVRSSPSPTLTLASDGARSSLAAKVDAGEGMAVATAKARLDAPALRGFRRTGAMEVSYAGLRYTLAASPRERDRLQSFFSACDPAAALPRNASEL